ncbi:hypothetical protein UlMin_043954 [Ulmus minor]
MKESKADEKGNFEDQFASDTKSYEDGEAIPNSHSDEKHSGCVEKSLFEATNEDSVNGKDKKGQNTFAHKDSQATDRKRNHFTKKSSMDFELPELVVFLQESSFHFVKDIRIDKGKPPPQDKCLVKNCELDHKTISCLLNSDADSKYDSKVETLVTLPSVQKGSKEKPTDVNESNKNGAKRNGSAKLMTEVVDFDDARDEVSNDQSTKMIVPESLLLVKEVQKADLTSSMVSSTIEKNDEKCVSVPKEMESVAITCHDDSSIDIISGMEEPSFRADCHQQASGIRNMAKIEDESSRSHENCSEESGLIAGCSFSGPIASQSFRSVSHRSNSSTTSSRSFAFPVLASEWNGSPERMAKAERRQQRQRRGWKFQFLCCKS